MNINEVRSIIRQTIAEAIEEKKQDQASKKSSGKLLELKKEMEGLKRMEEALGQFNLSEGGDGEFVAEYAHMQRFVNEFNKLKDAHARLSEMLKTQSSMVKQKIEEETQKIKEMIGLAEPAPKKPAPKKSSPKKDEAKKPAAKKEDKKEEPKKEKPAAKKDK